MGDIISNEQWQDEQLAKSIGVEFVEWAEKYYRLKEVYEELTNKEEENQEACPYRFVRSVFADHINQIILEKLRTGGIITI